MAGSVANTCSRSGTLPPLSLDRAALTGLQSVYQPVCTKTIPLVPSPRCWGESGASMAEPPSRPSYPLSR